MLASCIEIHEVFAIECMLLRLEFSRVRNNHSARPETNLCRTADVIFLEGFGSKMRFLSIEEESWVLEVILPRLEPVRITLIEVGLH